MVECSRSLGVERVHHLVLWVCFLALDPTVETIRYLSVFSSQAAYNLGTKLYINHCRFEAEWCFQHSQVMLQIKSLFLLI